MPVGAAKWGRGFTPALEILEASVAPLSPLLSLPSCGMLFHAELARVQGQVDEPALSRAVSLARAAPSPPHADRRAGRLLRLVPTLPAPQPQLLSPGRRYAWLQKVKCGHRGAGQAW